MVYKVKNNRIRVYFSNIYLLLSPSIYFGRGHPNVILDPMTLCQFTLQRWGQAIVSPTGSARSHDGTSPITDNIPGMCLFIAPSA